MPIPLHVDPSPVRELAAPLASVQPNAALQLEVDGARCTFAHLDAQGRAPFLDAVLAGWLVQADYHPAVSIVPAEPCEGMPPVETLDLPSTGWLVGLRAPARAVDAAGALQVAPVGEDGRWWLVAGTGIARLAATHDADPPTRFTLNFGEGQAAETVAVPLGGAAIVPGPALARPAASLLPTEFAELRIEGGYVVAIGRAAGHVAGAIRDGDGSPVPYLLQVGRPLGSSAEEIVVAAGATRRLALDAPADSAWTADERLATVDIKGARLLVHGHGVGRTHLVVRVGAEVYLVPVAIGL